MSSPSLTTQPLSSYDIASLRRLAIYTVIEALCYGMQVTLSIAAISALARKEGRAWILMVSVVVLYAISTAEVAATLLWNVIQLLALRISALDVDLDMILRTVNALTVTSANINYLVSDALVVWRAWILWPHSRVAHGVLLLCMAGTLAGAIAESVWAISDPFGDVESAKLSLSTDLPVCVTNVIATTLVGIQVWFHRRDVMTALGPFSGGSQVWRVLIILLESGVVYCSILISIIALDFTNNASEAYLQIYTAAYKLASIYPVFVIFVITAQEHLTAKSIIGGQSSFLASLQFVPGVSAPTRSEAVSSTSHNSEDIELVTRSQPADVHASTSSS